MSFFYFLYFPIYNNGHVKFDNHSKAVAFKKFKCLLYKYYPKFLKTFKKHPNKVNIRQVLVLLYDCVPNMKNY